MLALGTWLLLAAVSTLSIIYILMTTFARKRRPGEPDVVQGSWIWGSAPDFNNHAVDFLHRSQKKHGDCFTIRLINQYLTIIMDPHSYEAMSKERNFDFDPIQKQVNLNVFNFVLKDAKKMIKETAKTVRGDNIYRGMGNYVSHLNRSLENMSNTVMDNSNAADLADSSYTDGLRSFTSKTLFNAIFNTVFGNSDKSAFNSHMAHRNFDTFHKFFNYFWLGVPKILFPEAMKALGEMLVMPCSEELMQRDDLADYLRSAMTFLKDQGQTEADIKGHNLVYLHVNYNTFRVGFWVLNNLLENKKAYEALREEIDSLIEERLNPETNTASLHAKEVEGLKVLDSIVQESMRLASGVFMVRYITKDTEFTLTDGTTHLMRAGDRVAMYPPAIHKDPEIFENPLEFQYERFIDTTFYKNGKAISNPVIAFGSLCPGKRYATLQLKWYIMSVVSQFKLRLQEGEHAEYAYEYHGHEVLPPKKDVNIDCSVRKDRPVLQMVEGFA